MTLFFRLQSKLFKCSLYLSNPSGWNFKVSVGFYRFSDLVRPPRALMMLSPPVHSWLLQPYFPPLCTWQRSWIPAICARARCAGPVLRACEYLHTLWFLGLRVVKLAETDAAARRFPWLQHSSADEGWVQAKPAALSCGPDFLSLCLSYLPFFFFFCRDSARYLCFVPICLFCAPAGNTMMIVVESMSNGALDSFLRVRFFQGVTFTHPQADVVYRIYFMRSTTMPTTTDYLYKR